MPILQYYKKKEKNKEVTITQIDFYNRYKKSYLTGKILVDFVEFNYEIALESIRDLKEAILKMISPELTIDKLNEYLEIDILDIERLINWDIKFEFSKDKNEKYFNDFISAIKKVIKIFTEYNPIYIEYLVKLEVFFKDKIETTNAISLLSFLTEMEKDINNDKKLALKYRTAIDYCLHENGINNDLTPKIRFLIYADSDYITDRIEFMKLSYIDSIKRVKKKKTKLTGTEWKDFDYSFCQVYVTNIEETLYLEFIHLLTKEITLRKCKNCDRYFIGINRSKNLLYCNRKIPGSNKTCENVGSMNVYRENTQKNPILDIWRKAKDKNRKRKEWEAITPTEYKNWVFYGEKIKNKAEKGEISFSEFEKIMNYDIPETKKWIKTMVKEGEED
ncbi:MAG: hypothetical protein GYA02_08705 [Clostridiaceae bacterium]|jgi:hypothetical protein|nr:hypothetical protein [Clostridiaceae bacterium]